MIATNEKLREWIRNHTPARVPSLNTPDYFEMNFDNSWMVNYGSKLRKEENFDNMCFESSKPTVEYHEYGSQDSNNVETKVKPSSMHRETVAFTIRVKPGLLEKQQRRQRRHQQSHVNTSEDKVQLNKRKRSLDVEKTWFETLIFK